jgi:hypothetical protein
LIECFEIFHLYFFCAIFLSFFEKIINIMRKLILKISEIKFTYVKKKTLERVFVRFPLFPHDFMNRPHDFIWDIRCQYDQIKSWMDGWIVSGGVAFLHAGHKTGLMCTTVYLWCHNHLFCIRLSFGWLFFDAKLNLF